MKKIISLILAVMMVSAVFIGCANNTDDPADTTVADNGTSDTTAAAVDTEDPNALVSDDIPDDLKLNSEVTILYWEDSENPEFLSDGQTGEAVNDAIFLRNGTVQERLAVTMNFVGTAGNYENQENFVSKLNNDITSGLCEFDIPACYSMALATLSSRGLLQDLLQYDILNFEKPWWPASLTEESLIYDKLYFASGDISTNMLYMMYACFFNKDTITETGLESPYDLVDKNEWTLDKMIAMSENLYQDLNGDGNVDKADKFAFSLSSDVHVDPFYHASGLRYMDKQADGTPIVSADFSSEKAIDTVKKVKAYLSEGNYADITSGAIFKEGRSLFTYDRVQIASKSLKNEDLSYGIVPVPKYDSQQENYVTILGFPHTLYGISTASKHSDAAAATIECLASEGYRQITPVLFEDCMKFKYATDDQTSRMYDILRETVNFDIGRIFTYASFSKITFQLFRSSIKAGAADYASQVKAQKKMLDKYATKFAEAFQKLG